jgi:hypothetical protein
LAFKDKYEDMKGFILLSFSIIFSLTGIAQQHMFAQFGAGYYNGSGIQGNALTIDGSRSGGFGGEVTINSFAGNIVALGVGLDLMKFENTDHPFVPVFGDIKFIAPGKARFYFMIDPGYCFYNYSNQGSTDKGGLYIGSGIGIWFPSKTRDRLFFQAKYNFITINTSNPGDLGNSSGSVGVFSLLLGIKI